MGNCFSVQLGLDNLVIRGWDSIVGQTKYVCKLKQSLSTLSAVLEEMRVQRNDMQREVDLAEQRLFVRLERVQLWLSKAQTMITEAENLIADGPQEIDNLCLGSCMSKNCVASYKFGKKVIKMVEDIRDHMSKGVFEKLAESRPGASVVIRPDERPIALDSTIDEIWSCIKDRDVGIIGLYGIGGVGKTTLLTQINNKFSTIRKGFDFVIWALVTKDYHVENIQDRIRAKIGFLDEYRDTLSVEQKAEDIYGVLRNKKFVVLLDDLWERVDLSKVGIPRPSRENGSKLIFTTRSLEVCGEMGARKKIKVECMKPDDAWKLFKDKVGDETLNSHPDIPKLAEQVAQECGGLPLALITIGRAMACKTTPGEWKYAIEKLKRFTLPKLENEVFPILKFSYDNLSPTSKCCLLYCCMYPEDYNIPKKRLVEYWFCEGLLNEFDRISEAQMQGDHIINSLLSACLLERVEESIYGEEYVKMHDVIRGMPLWIACELEAQENKFFVKAGAQLFEEPNVKAWEGAKRMSVMQNQIEVFRETPKCPKLRTLFLNQNKLQVISDSFFRFIPHLTVLNFAENISLEALPNGISQLISLECLDLSWTNIGELPIELKSLTNLKMLDLSYTRRIRKIPPDLIPSLFKLQIFRMGYLPSGDIPDEVPQHLMSRFLKLQTFRMLYLPSSDYPKKDNVLDGVSNEKLTEELKSLQHLNILRIPAIQSMFALERFLSLHLFQCCTEALELRIFSASNVFNVLCLENMERLETLHFDECKNLEEMKMEKLDTRYSPDIAYSSRFRALSLVSIMNCYKLRDTSWLILVPNLRTLCIGNCREMEEIVSERKVGEVADVVAIPYPTPFLKLERIYLENLRELKSIYWDTLPFPCLKSIHVNGFCPELTKLPLNTSSAKGNHITIQGRQDWWTKLKWKNRATQLAFLPSFQSI